MLNTMQVKSKTYKDVKIYMYIALHRIFAELKITLTQPYLDKNLDEILTKSNYRVTKEDIKHEIMSNHFMTNKVLNQLESEQLISIEHTGKEYNIKITKKGVLYLRDFDRFYREVYKEQLKIHYAYRKDLLHLSDE